MQFSQLVKVYEQLEATTKKLEKRDILAKLYKSTDKLYETVLLSEGRVFADQDVRETGVATELAIKIVSKSFGVAPETVVKQLQKTGDLGLAAESFTQQQTALVSKSLTVEKVFSNLQKLPSITGTGSVDKKLSLVSELLTHASGKEAKYIIRIVLNKMRIGVAHGIVRDAIALAFAQEPKEVENAFNFLGDYGKVAELSKANKLSSVSLTLGQPIRCMLAERSEGLKQALNKFENPALEVKYDGLRVQIHKYGNKVSLFSRRLENISNQFPEIVKWSKNNLKDDCIIDGECIAISSSGASLPFQKLSKRIQRKYNIEKLVKEVPVKIHLFDILYKNNKNLMALPLKQRWNKLKQTVKPTKHLCLAKHLETKVFAIANKFYKEAIANGEEGVIVKNLDATYQPGRRVGYWLKVKDVLEPLDLVVVGAEWGEGKRAGFLASLLLAVRKNNKFLTTGKMASGLTDKQLKEVTKKLKPLITEKSGKHVKIKPQLVLEIGYEEIQKSPKYETGYALRFPRLLRFREDKSPEQANTLAILKKIYEKQRK
jgi:DNA ligase-1